MDKVVECYDVFGIVFPIENKCNCACEEIGAQSPE